MTLALVGVLPVSGVNLGLQASLGGLAVEAAKLQADFVGAFPALEAQVQVTANFPPSADAFLGPIQAALNPLELGAAFGSMGGITTDIQTDGALQLGFVTGQLAILEPLNAELGAGLNAGGIAGWTYSGGAAGMGERLEQDTANGFGSFGRDASVVAVIVATEDFASWRSFSEGVDTGASAEAEASPAARDLRFLGERGGASWNTGTAEVLARLDLLLAELRGQKAFLEGQAQLALGADLPEVDVVVDASLDVFGELGIDGVLDNLVNVQTDVDGMLGSIQAKIDASVSFVADIEAQLSAGGLSVWIYTGTARGLGREIRSALASGIPGGQGARAPAYGLVLAGSPPAMNVFGSVFRTAA